MDIVNSLVPLAVGIVGLAASVGAMIVLRRFTSFRLELMGIAIDVPKKASSVDSIEEKLERVEALTEEMAQLNAQIRRDLKGSLVETARLQDQAETAKNEAEVAKHLASFNDDQVSALRSVVKQDTRAGRWFQIGVAFVVFVLGVLSAIYVPELVNWLFPATHA